MEHTAYDPFNARVVTTFEGQRVVYYRLSALQGLRSSPLDRLPYAIKILLESVLRQVDGHQITVDDVGRLANWNPQNPESLGEIPFKPARVVLQDFTGVPAVVDLATMRDYVAQAGHDPSQINPLIPVDLVIDHSVQVDAFGTPSAMTVNIDKEFERNNERYRLLKWAQGAFRNFRAIPPDTGIVHQVNLEYLASVVASVEGPDGRVLFPDSVVGTDSHTTMINGLGVLGWGVGGIEAEANMLGQPLYFVTPAVVGFKMTGTLKEGVTATDLALTVTNILRAHGVVGKFVEFFGPGVAQMGLADRATVANMAPEYGATMGYFPVDEETLLYLKQTGRDPQHVRLVEWYLKEQGLFRTAQSADPEYSEVIELDLSTVDASLAGPKRPQDRVNLSAMPKAFEDALAADTAQRGFGLSAADRQKQVSVQWEDGSQEILSQGAVVIAAITSCTNTSNPHVMIGAGLLAKKAVQRGLKVPRYVKTSLAPGSRVVTEYLRAAGLLSYLSSLGFEVVGYGCTTCIGNSGPLPNPVAQAISSNDMTVAAVLSGNRNFEGRVHPLVKANYLASPPLVVAYALAGTMRIDWSRDPLGQDREGRDVFLKDIWPSNTEIHEALTQALKPELFAQQYAQIYQANPLWNQLPEMQGDIYQWDAASTYIQKPPFFENTQSPGSVIENARILALFGDSVTTDHISPAGNIALNSPAGRYLQEHGVEPKDFNSYGSRRGNHEVMMRGTFANIRIRNAMVPGTEGGFTQFIPTGDVLPIYDAAMRYQEAQTPLVVFAGKEYGTGSSRDWAAKGTKLLGVKAVIAQSFERIHRSNLVGMGVLPLQFAPGESWQSLGIKGDEQVTITLPHDLAPGAAVTVQLTSPDGTVKTFTTTARLDTPVDVEYYYNNGILQTVLNQIQ
ncbi:aconitate hydratase AcnA [Sulfobacillus sp. hq2]|uniref:aconitate hydratase AcnA n=1 Tax=Sulfobacillus TaxID=28033 RepID=UPI000CD184D0|nr:aconitate hydratase AcnA [Sulfobacillus sp. hq2]POB11481.1 aconitate hydratase AcnA [Sulfobacillus sp. hq2]